MRLAILLCPALAFAATPSCGDNVPGPAPADDLTLTVESPENGALALETSVTVRGVVTGGAESRLEVNGEPVALDRGGRFSSTLVLGAGTQLVEFLATRGDEQVSDLRAVSVGEFAPAGAVPDALRIQLGTPGLFAAGSEIIAGIDSAAIDAALTGALVKDEGTEAGCDLDRITIVSSSAPVLTIGMFEVDGELRGETTHNPFQFTLSAEYSDSSCTLVTDSLTFDTEEIHVEYVIDAVLTDGSFAVSAVSPTSPLDHTIVIDDSNLDPAVAARVTDGLASDLATAAIAIAMPQVESLTTDWLNRFAAELTVSAGSAELSIVTEPVALVTIEAGLVIHLERQTTVAGSDASTFVATPATPPALTSTHASVAIADDVVNQALGAVWRGGGFGNMSVPPVIRSVGDEIAVHFGGLLVGTEQNQSSVSGTLRVASTRVDGDLGLAPLGTVSSSIATAGSGASADAHEEALEALQRVTSELLATFAIPVADYAWPAVEARARGGYITIDTMQ